MGEEHISAADSYKRLLLAAKKLRGWDGDAEIAKGLQLCACELDLTAQRIGNWRKRGVSKDAIIQICSAIGCRPAWVQDGSGIMEDVGSGVGDADIDEAISILSSLHGRLRTKAVAYLGKEAERLISEIGKANIAP